jgi:outer membrane protein assembly factor BamB
MTFRHTGLALLGMTLMLPLQADDWPQFRGPNRDGKSLERGLLAQWPTAGPTLLWSVTGLGKGYTHAVVANGLVYITGLVGMDGILWAYTPAGKLAWQVNYGPEWASAHPGTRSIPTIHDGLLYIGSGVGNLSCFKAADGTPVWSRKLFDDYQAPQVKWGYAESYLIDGDNLIATPCGSVATMVALNRKTGAQVWASPSLGHKSSFCSPLLLEHGGRRLLVTMTDQAVVAFAAADGQVVWQHPYQNFRGNHPITPIYHDGMLYVTSGYGKGAIGLALSPDGGSVTQVWEQPIQDPCHGQAVLLDGYVYASSHQKAVGRWSCVEMKTGRLAWQDDGVGKGGSVIYADGLLYCYAEDGNLGLVKPSPERCEVVSSFKVPLGDGPHWAHPVVAGGRMYVRHGEALMCYDVAAR